MPRNATEAAPAPAAKLVSVDGRTYPLEGARIHAHAEGGLAMSSLYQYYSNPYDEVLELVYTMPLPADGAVLGYTIEIGKQRIVADVQPREAAARAYRKALHEGRTAGLLEQLRSDTFVQKLGNVPAHTPVTVRIDVLHPLAFVFEGAQAMPHWEYRFPTVVGVRYHVETELMPEGQALAPDRGDTPPRISLELAIRDVFEGEPHSPTHQLQAAHGRELAMVTATEPTRLDRDIVVRWPAAASEVGVRVAEGSGLPGDDGRYALITVVPPAQVRSRYPRDLIVLLDTSGSMGGEPLALAKHVVHELLGSLEPGDQFEIIEFSDEPRRMTPDPVAVSDHAVRDARHWLASRRASGGTEMSVAMGVALLPLRVEAQRQVVLVTDGQIDFESHVVEQAARARHVRLHVVGVGQCPNRSLTQQVAAAGRGLELLAGDAGSARDVAARLIAATSRPVLTQLVVGGSALAAQPVWALRDVFAGQPLLASVELAPDGGVLEVRGQLAGTREPWVQRVEIPAAYSPSAGYPHSALPLGAYHGRCVAGELELRRGMGRANDGVDIDRRIEALGMRHKIATSRTSLVAMEETPSADPNQPSRRVKLAVEMPAGMDVWGVGFGEYEEMGLGLLKSMAAGAHGAFTAMEAPFMDAMPPMEAEEADSWSMPSLPAPPSPKRRMLRDRVLSQVMRIEPVSLRWLSPGVLDLRFETPHDGFHLSPAAMRVRWSGELSHLPEIAVISILVSSPGGPHAKGLVVRVVLELGMQIEPGLPFEIYWAGQYHYVVECTAPDEPASERA